MKAIWCENSDIVRGCVKKLLDGFTARSYIFYLFGEDMA